MNCQSLFKAQNKTDSEGPLHPIFIKSKDLPEGQQVFRVKTNQSDDLFTAQKWNDTVLIALSNIPISEDLTIEHIYQLQHTTHSVSFEKDSVSISMFTKDKPVFAYHTTEQLPGEGLPDYYKRSGFIHPFYSPAGNTLTDGFPVGHTHQHGLFMTWVNTTYRGEKLDFWNQQNLTGTVSHQEIVDTISGPVFARLTVRLQHISLVHGPVIEEIRSFTVYNTDHPFLIDVHSAMSIPGKDTLFLNQYYYGGLAFRGNREWNAEDSVHFSNHMKFITAEGISKDSANHTRPGWAAAFGTINGDIAGIAILDHPSNFRYPQFIRVHPEMPYYCFIPLVDKSHALIPGNLYHSRYRILTYDGQPDVEIITRVADHYSSSNLE